MMHVSAPQSTLPCTAQYIFVESNRSQDVREGLRKQAFANPVALFTERVHRAVNMQIAMNCLGIAG